MFGVSARVTQEQRSSAPDSYLNAFIDDRCDVSGVVCRPGSLKKRDLFPAAPQGGAESDMRPKGAWQVPCAVPGGDTPPWPPPATHACAQFNAALFPCTSSAKPLNRAKTA